MGKMNYDVIIIGGGAAGLSAALWCAELKLETLLLERGAELGGSTAARLQSDKKSSRNRNRKRAPAARWLSEAARKFPVHRSFEIGNRSD
jgi:flavin-dependent dehydrogenase